MCLWFKICFIRCFYLPKDVHHSSPPPHRYHQWLILQFFPLTWVIKVYGRLLVRSHCCLANLWMPSRLGLLHTPVFGLPSNILTQSADRLSRVKVGSPMHLYLAYPQLIEIRHAFSLDSRKEPSLADEFERLMDWPGSLLGCRIVFLRVVGHGKHSKSCIEVACKNHRSN